MDNPAAAFLQEAVVATLLALLAACGASSERMPASPAAPAPPAAPLQPLTVVARCLGPFRAGTYAPLACFVEVAAATPPSTHLQAFADLRVFGGSERTAITQCPACGLPAFDLDIHFPETLQSGTKTFAVMANDSEGRTGTATASLEIVR